MNRDLCWILCAALAGASSIFAQEPRQLYITAEFVTDYHPHTSQIILEVTPAANDTLIREIRVAPLSDSCWRTITVRAAEVTLKDTSPGQMVARNNPCACPPDSFRQALQKYGRRHGILDSVGFGIVAQCGGREVVLKFPFREEVDWQELEKGEPVIAHLWRLASEIEAAGFGSAKPFEDNSAARDLELQRAGKDLVPELASGRFDAGLLYGSLRDELANYHGPVRAPDQTPRLVNAGEYQFVKYVPPIYPRSAKAMGIEGSVELKLKTDPRTGAVRRAHLQSGPAIFKDDAINSAMQWRFAPGATSSHPFNAMLDFSLRCP